MNFLFKNLKIKISLYCRMIRHLLILLLLPLCIFAQDGSNASHYANSEYYLVDSLNLNDLSKEDSLVIEYSLKKYHSTEIDTVKVQSLDTICNYLNNSVWEKYQFFQYELIKFFLLENKAEKTNKALYFSLAGALNNIAYIKNNNNELNEALKYYRESIEIREKFGFKYELANSYVNISGIYSSQGNISLAMEHYLKALRIKEDLKDLKGVGLILSDIGVLYSEQGDAQSSLDFYLKSLKIRDSIQDLRGLMQCNSNIGMVYKDLKKYNLALDYMFTSLDIAQKINDKVLIAAAYNNLGSIYGVQDSFLLAKEYYFKCLEIVKQFNYKKGLANAYNNIANIAFEENLIDGEKGALLNAKKSLEISQDLGFPLEIKNASLLLFKIYEQKGNTKQALKMHKLFVQMKDSLTSEETIKSTVRQQSRFEYEKQKALDDAENEKQLDAERHATEKQAIFTYTAIAGAILILFFLIFIYNRLQITRKQNKIIEQQKIVLSETNEELNQTNEEIAAQRDEIESQKNKIEEVHKEIKDSINYAKRIQEAILPPLNQINKYFPQSFVLYHPKDVVAGDFYWQENVGERVYIGAADCTGHGVPGAMVSVVCSNALNKTVLEDGIIEVGEILDRTREIVIDKLAKNIDIKDGMDISLASFDFERMKLDWAGANNPLYLLREGHIQIIKGDREPIGFTENPTPFTINTFDIQKGDAIYLFTDGYADQFGGSGGKKLGYKKFREKLIEISTLAMDDQKKKLYNYFMDWKAEEEQVDDVCVIGIKV